MLIIFRVDDRLTERFWRFPPHDIMNTLDEAPTLPCGEQARNCVSQTVLEGRHHDAACGAGHTLHIAQNKRSSDAVRLAGASPRDDNGGVRAYKLRKGVGA